MSLNISELLNPSPPSPAPPHPQSTEDSTPSSTNINTQTSPTQVLHDADGALPQGLDSSSPLSMSVERVTILPGWPIVHDDGSIEKRDYRSDMSADEQAYMRDRKLTVMNMSNPRSKREQRHFATLLNYEDQYYGAPKSVDGQQAYELAIQRFKGRSAAAASPKPLTGQRAQSVASPVEPSPPLERTATSPTLEQYHHPSGEAEVKRRQSFVATRTSPPPILPPIQSPVLSATSPIAGEARTEGDGSKAIKGEGSGDEMGTMDVGFKQTAGHFPEQNKKESGGQIVETPSIQAAGDATALTQHAGDQSEAMDTVNYESVDRVPIKTEAPAPPPFTTQVDQQEANPVTKKVANLKRENSRASSAEMSSPTHAAPTPNPSASTAKTAGVKRKAPTSGAKIAAEKKGIAKPSQGKKRKILEDSDATSSARRTGSPASSRASKTPAPKNTTKQSNSVASSPPAEENDDVEMEDGDDYDEDQVFCICRKPDDHSWMIACDGGCEDWFHGRCVDMKEADGNLIDKYICPNCNDKGRGQTTWKPICRNEPCRNPARVTENPPSKYCSDECGRNLMRKAAHVPIPASERASPSKKRRKAAYTDNAGDDDSTAFDGEDKNDQDYKDGDEEPSRGGVLTTSELKAAIHYSKNADQFRKLGGEGFLSPPSTTSPENGVPNPDTINNPPPTLEPSYTPNDLSRLSELKQKHSEISQHRQRLVAKEKFISLIRLRGKTAVEKVKTRDKSLANMCIYDPRISWSDAEFDEFRDSEVGRTCLEGGAPLPPPEGAEKDPNYENEDEAEVLVRGLCQKKKCTQHLQWVRIFVDAVGLEQGTLREEEEKLDEDERGIRERALVRGLEGTE